MTLEYLLRACELCEHGSAVAALRQVVFSNGRLTAFSGVVQYQAPSGLDPSENFAVSDDRLSVALRNCGEDFVLDTTKDFLRFKNGPLAIRVRKITEGFQNHERIAIPKSAAGQKTKNLHAALKRVQPFMSSDASRPWSVSVLLKDGYAWATNNLALVRSPIDLNLEMQIPAPTVDFLCSLPDLSHYHIDDQRRIIFMSGRTLMRSPQTSAPWPDLDKFFAKMPKKLEEIPPSMSVATRTVGKLADRFVSLSKKQVEARETALESDYEVDFAKGTGKYSAKLLTLILEHATHADFSFYPDPIFFRGELLEGTAVGMRE